MDTLELHATPRTVTGKQVSALRREGITPGVIYGHGIDPISVQFNAHDLERSISKGGTSSTVQVHVEGVAEPYLAIFRDVQYHPIQHSVMHIDLQALNIKEKVRMPIPVTLVGTAPVVEEGGVLLQLLNEVEIEALPMDLVSSIEVDVSVLTEIGTSILVSDIVPPKGIAILTSQDDLIAQTVRMEEEEEEEEEVEEELEADEVEVITSRGDEGEGEDEA